MNHALREGPTRDLGVSRAGRGLPGLRGSSVLRRDADIPFAPVPGGTKQAGTRSCSRPVGAQIVPSAPPPPPPPPFSLSYEPVQRQLHPQHPSPPPPGPCSAPREAAEGFWGHRLSLSRAAQPRLSPGCCRNFVSLRSRVAFCRDGAAHAWEPGGQQWQRGCASLLSCGKPGWKRNPGFKGRGGAGASSASAAATPSV